jgi:hypothetical protein
MAKPMPAAWAFAELGIERVERGDSDHAAGEVDECAAGVARVDLGAGLEEVGQRHAVALADLAVERRDDALGDARLEPERVPDREHDLPRKRCALPVTWAFVTMSRWSS